MDLAAVNRILAAVGRHPADLDRAELADRLSKIAALYRAIQSLKAKPAKRRKDAERLCKDLLKMKERVEKCLASPVHLISYPAPPWEHSAAFDRMISDIAMTTTEDKHRLSTVVAVFSKTDYLVFLLSNEYERSFHKVAGRSTNEKTKARSGPFIRFAEAAIAELEIKRISREQIAGAVTKIRRLKKEAADA